MLTSKLLNSNDTHPDTQFEMARSKKKDFSIVLFFNRTVRFVYISKTSVKLSYRNYPDLRCYLQGFLGMSSEKFSTLSPTPQPNPAANPNPLTLSISEVLVQ